MLETRTKAVSRATNKVANEGKGIFAGKHGREAKERGVIKYSHKYQNGGSLTGNR